MAITPASFVPEQRGAQGPDNYGVGLAKNVDAAGSAGSAAQTAAYEAIPANSFSPLPIGSGAGDGSVTIKRIAGPGPTNAGPSGPSAPMVD